MKGQKRPLSVIRCAFQFWVSALLKERMKRFTSIFIGCLLILATSLAIQSSFADEIKLIHDWKETHEDGDIRFSSNHPAPFPFSTKGEPEATITISSEAVSPERKSLTKIISSEIKDIRKEIQIAEYMEEDGHKPDKDIVKYIEDIEGVKVGFIKYRAAGLIGGSSVLPRTVIHGIFIKGDMVHFVHLIVIFAGHQNEVREDQLQLIKSLIKA
jgi:hypothetical protein